MKSKTRKIVYYKGKCIYKFDYIVIRFYPSIYFLVKFFWSLFLSRRAILPRIWIYIKPGSVHFTSQSIILTTWDFTTLITVPASDQF